MFIFLRQFSNINKFLFSNNKFKLIYPFSMMYRHSFIRLVSKMITIVTLNVSHIFGFCVLNATDVDGPCAELYFQSFSSISLEVVDF